MKRMIKNLEAFVWTPALQGELHRYWESLDKESRSYGRAQNLKKISRKLNIPEPIVEKNLAEMEAGKGFD